MISHTASVISSAHIAVKIGLGIILSWTEINCEIALHI